MALVAPISSCISALVNVIGLIEKNVDKYYQRKDLRGDIKLRLEIVKNKFQGINNQLPLAESVVASNAILAESLSIKQMEVEAYYNRVRSWEDRIQSSGILNRVNRMNDILKEFADLADGLIGFFNDKVSPLLSSDQSTDKYIPISNVPPNPPRLTLDFSSIATNEGKLKHAILEKSEERVVAFIASGQGGVGKTCALRGLNDDIDLKQRFPGGILYIQLGNDAKKADIIRELAEIVYQTGGTQLSQEITALDKVQEACKKASRWFSRYTCLFLVDDLWHVNGIDKNIIKELGRIVHNKSRMAYTSRDRYFLDASQGFIKFEAKEANGNLARAMLLNHSSFSIEELNSFEEKNISALDYILSECQGLPLALGIIGGTILTRSQEYGEDSKQNVWSDYRNVMEQYRYVNEYAGQLQSRQEMPLHRIVDLSLNVLNKRYPENKFSLLFRALSVIRKQQMVTVIVLQKIWGFKTIEETKGMLQHFFNVSLIQLSRKSNENMSIQLHDLVLDIAKHEASSLGEFQHFHSILINNYSNKIVSVLELSQEASAVLSASKLGVLQQRGGKRFIKWWAIPADGFIHENVCNLLHRGEKIDELLWLLSQPEWIIYRFLNGGILEVTVDLNEGIVALENSASFDERREHLEIIENAVRLSGLNVYKNPSEAWFQVYSRLQQHAMENKWTKYFIRSIESAAPRPWVRAPMGVVQQSRVHLRGFLKSQGIILCTRLGEGVVWFVWRKESKLGITSWDINTGNEKTKKIETTFFEKNCCFESYPAVFGASFSGCGLKVTVAAGSFKIDVFNRESGEMERCLRLKLHSNMLRRNVFRCCFSSDEGMTRTIPVQNRIVAISRDGKYIATSNDTHNLQIWSSENGEPIGSSLRGHTNVVNCFEMNKEGTRIVTGGQDNTIRIWNAQSGEAIGTPLRGHTNGVTCLTMSVDGNQVVSGARDKSVRLWDIRSGKSIGEPFLGHKESVWCVRISEDGSTIVSGSIDSTLIVWDAQKSVMKGQPLRGHTDMIRHVEISGDGSIAVSASGDDTVRVWDTKRNEGEGAGTVGIKNVRRKCVISGDGTRCLFQTGKGTAKVVDTLKGETIGSRIRFDIASVECMGMSADDRRVVFGLKGGNLIVFDAMSGKKIGVRVRGHTLMVWCVTMSRDGRTIVSGSRDKTLRIWDTKSGESIGKLLVGHSGPVACVALSADRSRVVSGSWDMTVRVWDAQSGEAIGRPLRGHTSRIRCVGINEDSTKVVSGSDDGTVRLWDAQSSQQIAGPFQHDSQVYCLGFNDNISKIATICRGGSQRLWDVQTGSCGPRLSSHQRNSEINRLSLSWNGRFNDMRKRQIIDIDENGNERVLATTEVNVFNGPGSDFYFSKYSDPLEVVR